jgi:hypothetical protein
MRNRQLGYGGPYVSVVGLGGSNFGSRLDAIAAPARHVV